MEMVRLFLFGAALLGAAAASATTLHFAGDSTLDDAGYSLGGRIRAPYYSWGTQLQKSMKSGNAVANYARSGASTKSFAKSGMWAKLIAGVKPGDFVAIQFGHNDQKRSSEFYRNERWADPKGLFREIVRGWVKEVRSKGASPILVSPICRATFDKDGRKLVDVEHKSDGVCLRSYRDAMRELSEELGCDFVDMNNMTRDLMERIGRDAAWKFFVISTGVVRGKDGEPAQDVTHPIQTGAEAFAKLFLDDVRARGLAVSKLFKDADFPITEFGAKAGGAKCTAAFAKAMEACEKAGGGRVVVPAGRWFTGAVRMRSNCELHLAEGAEVVFSQDPADYLPAVHTSWEGMECWNYSPLVYAYCCTNVAITGSGALRGYEGEWKDTAWHPWVPQTNGVKAARLQLYTWGATDHPVGKRQIWKMPNAHTRPQLVQFNRCRGVTWDGFKVRNSPFWTLHLYMCEDAAVRNLDVYAHGNNNDGIDVEMSRNVVIESCRFDQGDDGIVIKSGRNRDAWRLATPTEDVFVRDCEIVNAHTLLGIGSEISGGVRNLRLVNCRGRDVNRAIFVKTNRRRGGTLENISVDGVEVGRVRHGLVELSVDTLYEWADFPDYENRATAIRGVDVRNVRGGQAKRRLNLVGDPKAPAKGFRLRNVVVDSAEEPDVVENVEIVEDSPGAKDAPQARTKVMLFFDTEDFTSDRSSDAIRDIANLLAEEKVVGHFAMVGLLCEELVRLRRTDVLDALKAHAIGTQTYGHSLHPTVCELSDRKDFGEAYRAVLAREAEGIGMIRAATAVDQMIFQVPPGNSWSYVSYYAYADLGVKFIGGGGFTDHPLDSNGCYGAGGVVRKDNVATGLWYCNCYQIPYSHLFGLEDFLPRDKRPQPDVKALLDKGAKRDLVVLYMHPHMAVKTQHWDGVNYRRGNLAEWGRWKPTPDRPAEDTRVFYERLRSFVRTVKADPRFEFVDLRDFEKTLKPRVAITRGDVPAIRRALGRRLSAVDLPKSWSVSDCFQAAVRFLRGDKSFMPGKSWGFLERPKGVKERTVVLASDLRDAAARLDADYFLPPEIDVGGKRIGPADFLFAALEAIETGSGAACIEPRDQLGSFDEVPGLERVDIKGGWGIHADTFEDRYCSERLKLQLWTLRIE